MTVLERIKETARLKKNISLTVLEQQLGYSNGSLAKAKDIPSSRIKDIADFLEVSMEYLMTGEDKSDLSDKKYYINEETAEMADKIFHSKELRLLFDAARDAQPEDLETVHHMLLALKRKERGDID